TMDARLVGDLLLNQRRAHIPGTRPPTLLVQRCSWLQPRAHRRASRPSRSACAGGRGGQRRSAPLRPSVTGRKRHSLDACGAPHVLAFQQARAAVALAAEQAPARQFASLPRRTKLTNPPRWPPDCSSPAERKYRAMTRAGLRLQLTGALLLARSAHPGDGLDVEPHCPDLPRQE